MILVFFLGNSIFKFCGPSAKSYYNFSSHMTPATTYHEHEPESDVADARGSLDRGAVS
jgi:hypothetical protein